MLCIMNGQREAWPLVHPLVHEREGDNLNKDTRPITVLSRVIRMLPKCKAKRCRPGWGRGRTIIHILQATSGHLASCCACSSMRR